MPKPIWSTTKTNPNLQGQDHILRHWEPSSHR